MILSQIDPKWQQIAHDDCCLAPKGHFEVIPVAALQYLSVGTVLSQQYRSALLGITSYWWQHLHELGDAIGPRKKQRRILWYVACEAGVGSQLLE